jgi:predicted GNAT family acetyltransferase
LAYKETLSSSEFIERTKALLHADEIGNSALLSVLARGGSPKVAAWIENQEGEAVCAIYRTVMPFGNLVGESSLEALADALPVAAVEGVYGRAGSAEIFADRYCARRGDQKRLDLEMTLYACEHVTLPAIPRGAFRLATSQDAQFLERWHEEFAGEAKVHAPAGTVQRGLENRTIWLWEDGEARCMTNLTDATPNLSRIGWVYTPSAHRKAGYASALVARLTQKSLASGRRAVTLTADVANPASNSIYRRMGYVERGLTRVYEFR